MAGENYIIPLAIDASGLLTGFEAIESGLDNITTQAKTAGVAISEVMGSAGRASDNLNAKIVAGAGAAKKLQDAANAAGVDLNKAFSGDNLSTAKLETKVATFVAKMKDAIGKPIDFKFNLDQSRIDVLTGKLKEAKGQMEAFELVIASAKNRLGDFIKGSDPFNALKKQIQQAEDFLNVLREDVVEVKQELATPAPDTAIKSIGEQAKKAEEPVMSIRAQLRIMREELAQMELAGKGGTAQFIELSKRAGDLADQFGDTSQRVKALASDTKRLDAGISAVRGLAGAFAVGQGALAAFGEQSEEAEKAIQKVQGAMAILQGIQEIANVLNKDSALSIYLQTYARGSNTAAIVAETAAIEAETAATVSATAATNAWTSALLLNPITAIIAVLATAVITTYQFVQAQKDATLSAKGLNEALKRQAELVQADYDIIQRRQNLDLATAEAQRKTQSELTTIKIQGLRARQRADLQDIADREALIARSRDDDKESIEARAAAVDEIRKIEEKLKNTANDIQVEIINQQKQANEEQNKLQLDLLHQRQANADQNKAILDEAAKYAAEIRDINIAELRDGQQKELSLIQQATKAKIDDLDKQGQVAKEKLTLQAKEIALDIESNKAVLAEKIKGLEQAKQLEEVAGKERLALKKKIEEQALLEQREINEKYRQQQADFEFRLAQDLLTAQEETAAIKEELLRLTAAHEIDIIERTNDTKENKNLAALAIERKLAKDLHDLHLKSNLDQIELDRQSNINRLNAMFDYAKRTIAQQKLINHLILQEEANAAERRLQALRQSGAAEESAIVQQAIATADKAQQAIKDNQKTSKPTTFLELYFPKSTPEELKAIQTIFDKTLPAIGDAITAYTNMLISEYQKQIDAQKKLVEADDNAIAKLEDRLKTEQQLREDGFASNVAGVERELAAKNKQREEDIKKQEEYQKKMEKVQKAQIAAQTALQAVNLITSSTNIYLALSPLGPAGVATAAVTIAAMVGAFIAAKAQALEAVGPTTQFGKGGEIDGKSHEHGGQKYISKDGRGGVVELEGGEFVTRKDQAQKYKPLLRAINDKQLEMMSDDKVLHLLSGLGVHLDINNDVVEAVMNARNHEANQIIMLGAPQTTPEELKSIDTNISTLVQAEKNKVTQWDDENYRYITKGQTTIRKRKK